ncbi:hypothetical protein 101101UKE1_053 [Escherichia phage vB_EcoP-101101UKE1]|uniref:Uncharacterized protein n=1 Tax=Escherichia phage vB_EcoP-101101UKE1 TaxID=2865789 RepID=A0AAE8C2U9_9CAUD|nr:hypothetical protein 101101UKE1_053 [Escherichia phage vB_EcoP-101101UKE1]
MRVSVLSPSPSPGCPPPPPPPIGWPEGIRLRRAGLMYSLDSTREAEGTPRTA